MKKFDIPLHYHSNIIAKIKNARKLNDPRKKDFAPTILDFGNVQFLIPRHFGFCYGVENAIEIAYKTIEANPGKRIYLLSEMIHNPGVNKDLESMGIKFIMDTSGKIIIPWENLMPDDIVIIPAFGTTLEIERKLNETGINPYTYNTTCPFVEKVWNRADQLGEGDYTVVIHGKHTHEETRATFSHATKTAPAVIIRDAEEANFLSGYIVGEKSTEEFLHYFEGKLSDGFNPESDLEKIGVVNQTTMLATETEAIAGLLKKTMIKKFGIEKIKGHFADTRDTLCYATNDNQEATYGVLKEKADLAIVVGGYNSSNTSHIVELCEEKLPTYFISSEVKLISENLINHFDIQSKTEIVSIKYLPKKQPVKIIITSGASCPDAVVDSIIIRLL
ncbi:MAG: 4-hydroxy-3-methylbut-2-enyl diphosphate reductase, partial [Ignavibacteriaceae bacterium]|nr:4-hydroxy-3-methylbut-2-enyl diphosphate reductase [Ignavibacteriaceae bacterium]